jgi:hypothetical protein
VHVAWSWVRPTECDVAAFGGWRRRRRRRWRWSWSLEGEKFTNIVSPGGGSDHDHDFSTLI